MWRVPLLRHQHLQRKKSLSFLLQPRDLVMSKKLTKFILTELGNCFMFLGIPSSGTGRTCIRTLEHDNRKGPGSVSPATPTLGVPTGPRSSACRGSFLPSRWACGEAASLGSVVTVLSAAQRVFPGGGGLQEQADGGLLVRANEKSQELIEKPHVSGAKGKGLCPQKGKRTRGQTQEWRAAL